MKKCIFTLTAFLVINSLAMAQTFTLKSKDLGKLLTHNQMANSFGCDGKNISPQLYWENAPNGTQHFAITIFDKDARKGKGFWHWIVYNIPANVMELKDDAGNVSNQNIPKGAMQGPNDGGKEGYVGACPPKGEKHEYIITIYALKTKLTVKKDAKPAEIGALIKKNSMANATLSVYGERK